MACGDFYGYGYIPAYVGAIYGETYQEVFGFMKEEEVIKESIEKESIDIIEPNLDGEQDFFSYKNQMALHIANQFTGKTHNVDTLQKVVNLLLDNWAALAQEYKELIDQLDDHYEYIENRETAIQELHEQCDDLEDELTSVEKQLDDYVFDEYTMMSGMDFSFPGKDAISETFCISPKTDSCCFFISTFGGDIFSFTSPQEFSLDLRDINLTKEDVKIAGKKLNNFWLKRNKSE